MGARHAPSGDVRRRDRSQSRRARGARGARGHLDLLERCPSVPRALYGDRGETVPGRVVEALAWPAAVRARIEVAVVPGAAHFPMVEAPLETARALEVLLD